MLPYGTIAGMGLHAVQANRASNVSQLYLQQFQSMMESMKSRGGGGGDGDEDSGEGEKRPLSKDERRGLSRQRIERDRRAANDQMWRMRPAQDPQATREGAIVRNVSRGVADDETLRGLGLNDQQVKRANERASEYGSSDPNVPRRNPETIEAIERATDAAVQDPHPTSVDQLINSLLRPTSGQTDKPIISSRGKSEAPEPLTDRLPASPEPAKQQPNPSPRMHRRPPPPPIGTVEYMQWLTGNYEYMGIGWGPE